MTELIFATANKNKLVEIEAILPEFISLTDLDANGIKEDIPETGDTFQENARIKAEYVYQRTGKNVFAEDTGLEVYALDMQPGVHTARYAGPGKDSNANIDLLLERLNRIEDRRARFNTCISLFYKGEIVDFIGYAEGTIATERKGDSGFGYDPIFIPTGYSISFAEMPGEEKRSISHRTKAFSKMVTWLEDKGSDELSGD